MKLRFRENCRSDNEIHKYEIKLLIKRKIGGLTVAYVQIIVFWSYLH